MQAQLTSVHTCHSLQHDTKQDVQHHTCNMMQAEHAMGTVGKGNDIPMVLSPAGSTCLARCKASDVARSAFAGVTARMMALSPCKVKVNEINA